MKLPTRIASAAVAAVAAVGLSACSTGDVELNGAVFDYLGVSSKSQGPKQQARLAPRAGIVVPPSSDKLPEPGSGVETASVADQWPVDPDERRVSSAVELERRHAAFCQDALWRAKAAGNNEPIKGPNGLCNPSILSTVGVNNSIGRPKEGAGDPTSQLPSTFKRN
jgi:hypothetical protein